MIRSHVPRKRFGQHFLRDADVIRRIVQTIGPEPEHSMVEIGPGLGALTVPLLKRLERLQVVELDRDVIPPLQAVCAPFGDLRVHQVDALTVNFSQLRVDDRPLRLVGNLPYNISTPLLFHLLNYAASIQDMYFMLQKEVVERMSASPGDSTYGRLSVMLQYRCDVLALFAVGPGAFQPPPKVASAFVRLVPHRRPPVEVHDEARFAEVVRQAFSQRRKTLRNALRPLLSAQQIEAAGIDPSVRPQTLTIKEFAVLSNLSG